MYHTSGNVPFEKTLQEQNVLDAWRSAVRELVKNCLHQQTGLSAGTVTNNDELAPYLRHYGAEYSGLGLRRMIRMVELLR